MANKNSPFDVSLPTFVTGISVPGQLNGPLSALFKNEYDRSDYNYPRDLGTNPTRSHVIRFTSFKPASTQPQVISNVIEFGQTAAASVNAIGQAALTGDIEGVFKAGQPVVDAAKPIFQAITASDVNRVVDKTISLYIPDTLNVSYSASYDEISLTESLGKTYFLAQAGSSIIDYFKAAKDKTGLELANQVANDPFVRSYLAGVVGNLAGASNLRELALRGIGQAFNPQLQVLFRGIGFRSFQFDFLFTPYNQEESLVVKNIVKAFKFAAAPEITPSAVFSQGMFVKVPYPFKIEFFYKNKKNDNVHQIGQCVLENVNVDYAPNGWATFDDGSPVQIRMSLQFKETEIIDKNKIEAGY